MSRKLANLPSTEAQLANVNKEARRSLESKQTKTDKHQTQTKNVKPTKRRRKKRGAVVGERKVEKSGEGRVTEEKYGAGETQGGKERRAIGWRKENQM